MGTFRGSTCLDMLRSRITFFGMERENIESIAINFLRAFGHEHFLARQAQNVVNIISVSDPIVSVAGTGSGKVSLSRHFGQYFWRTTVI